ncbi:hypothetical protein [Xanthomonas campestris]|uniref:hypothetical protein n=1 Tax=Xanthomonas campestris TaxID=339 RepID=UPI0023674C28|nr:hypothetical protein [Xanthomonas campestris]MEA9762498.1 hypothetical protein [Xanthomonas campestris pv. raphani]MEA9814788.1 hypothetical protein [Xanthomonas campestris pv. raphani]MEA9908058.1 hypothetical protein [Xanthomonas campestris pv. raphani]MEA9924145.1 hypothetical protein [Xanthomonas campestris pv. raphani]MEA9936829.1 hypothetical protein [Xanthomonas campestris pv. raphani]
MSTYSQEGRLTEKDHNNVDHFLRVILTGYAEGKIELKSAIGILNHVITAIDQGNVGEARRFFEEGTQSG